MGMGDQSGDIGNRISRLGTRAKNGTTNVYRVRAMDDRFDTEVGVFGGSQQFERAFFVAHETVLTVDVSIVYAVRTRRPLLPSTGIYRGRYFNP